MVFHCVRVGLAPTRDSLSRERDWTRANAVLLRIILKEYLSIMVAVMDSRCTARRLWLRRRQNLVRGDPSKPVLGVPSLFSSSAVLR